MNWGHGIIAGFALFAAYILYFVFSSFNQRIDLVAEDYYAQEVAYQDRINDMENASALKDDITVQNTETGVQISFPLEWKNAPAGNVRFFRPSDVRKDFIVPLELDEQSMLYVPGEKFTAGRYEVQISWQANGRSFYVKKDLFI